MAKILFGLTLISDDSLLTDNRFHFVSIGNQGKPKYVIKIFGNQK